MLGKIGTRLLRMSRPAACMLAVVVCLFPGLESAQALPWDTDMYRQPSLKANEVSRSPAEGTVPIGYEPFTLTLEEAEQQLKNPVALDKNSAWRGQRLFNANCSACHNLNADGQGTVGKLMGVPDLRGDFYKTKTDGRIFGVIHYGLRQMPRYGYKFSAHEQWDIINYLRVLQGTQVSGFSVEKE